MSSNDTNSSSIPGARLRWWTVVALLFLLLITPGPAGSPVSGVPLSSQAQLVFVLSLVLLVFTSLFPPTSRVHVGWILLLVVLVGGKTALSLDQVRTGWHASYWTVGLDKQWKAVRFQGDLFTLADHRIDREIAFDGRLWGLHFINSDIAIDQPTDGPRDIALPLRVRWLGYARTPTADGIRGSINANGKVTLQIDESAPLSFVNPRDVAVHTAVPAGEHRVIVDYEKPPMVVPNIVLAGAPLVFPVPTTPQQIASAEWRRWTASGLGWIALLVAIIAFTSAYAPVSQLVLFSLWLAPKKLGALAFFVYFAISGALHAIPQGSMTFPLTHGDDTLGYEAMARQVVFNGLLMTNDEGIGKTYHASPLYPYGVALAHLIFGEKFASVITFNYICLGLVGLAVYFILKRYLTSGAFLFALVLCGLMLRFYYLTYADTSFSDNLYFPVVFATIAVAVAAVEQRRGWLMWIAGILTALGAATRPSFVFFAPVFVLALFFDFQAGALARRIREIAIFSTGFLCGVAPFTIRNWIVAHKFVLLVSSFIMLPYFLYMPDAPIPVITFSENSLVGSVGDFIRIWAERPRETAWVEVQKILFTFGFLQFGPAQTIPMPKALVVWPVLFALALWLGRIPRAPRQVLLVFLVSHVIAMVIGAPWTYGYKTVLPFHLAMLIGASFLLPHWGQQWWRTRVELPRRLTGGPRTVSVVLPTYNEKDSIRGVVEDFFATGLVSEVLVINNNAVAGTSEEVAGTGAREIFESRQGYGAAIRRGLVESRGDLICICEPDGTFLARDVTKLVAFADDFDVVYGSRTSQQFIWQGANMGVFLRWGNWAVAKYMQFLYNATSLTDVGCTMRLIRREVAERLRDRFTIDGSQFGPEMMVLSLKEHFHVIQVPVNYLPRVGESAVTGDPAKAFWLGIQMIWLITRHRFEGSRKDLWTSRAGEASTARERLS